MLTFLWYGVLVDISLIEFILITQGVLRMFAETGGEVVITREVLAGAHIKIIGGWSFENRLYGGFT